MQFARLVSILRLRGSTVFNDLQQLQNPSGKGRVQYSGPWWNGLFLVKGMRSRLLNAWLGGTRPLVSMSFGQ